MRNGSTVLLSRPAISQLPTCEYYHDINIVMTALNTHKQYLKQSLSMELRIRVEKVNDSSKEGI